jgi:hypothetical protein
MASWPTQLGQKAENADCSARHQPQDGGQVEEALHVADLPLKALENVLASAFLGALAFRR